MSNADFEAYWSYTNNRNWFKGRVDKGVPITLDDLEECSLNAYNAGSWGMRDGLDSLEDRLKRRMADYFYTTIAVLIFLGTVVTVVLR